MKNRLISHYLNRHLSVEDVCENTEKIIQNCVKIFRGKHNIKNLFSQFFLFFYPKQNKEIQKENKKNIPSFFLYQL